MSSNSTVHLVYSGCAKQVLNLHHLLKRPFFDRRSRNLRILFSIWTKFAQLVQKLAFVKSSHLRYFCFFSKQFFSKGWNPPFAVDVNTFRFTPRIQRLYELEAHSRLKLDFIGKLFQFFRLQGLEKLKIPNVGGQYLDVFWLYKHVTNAGGYDRVTADKMWPHIAELLGYSGNKFATIIKTNYEKLLLKYELMLFHSPSPSVSVKRPSSLGSEKSTPAKRTRLHAQEEVGVLFFSLFLFSRMTQKSTTWQAKS